MSSTPELKRVPNTSKRIVVIQGHPDPNSERFGRALANAYAEAARKASHEVRQVDVTSLTFPLLRSQTEWSGSPPADIAAAQADVAWAEHIVVFFPLWLGDMPALVKGFWEQVFRPGFAIAKAAGPASWRAGCGGGGGRLEDDR